MDSHVNAVNHVNDAGSISISSLKKHLLRFEICRLERCIDEIHEWLAMNRLRLNLDKTELVYYSLITRIGTFRQPSLSIGRVAVTTNHA